MDMSSSRLPAAISLRVHQPDMLERIGSVLLDAVESDQSRSDLVNDAPGILVENVGVLWRLVEVLRLPARAVFTWLPRDFPAGAEYDERWFDSGDIARLQSAVDGYRSVRSLYPFSLWIVEPVARLRVQHLIYSARANRRDVDMINAAIRACVARISVMWSSVSVNASQEQFRAVEWAVRRELIRSSSHVIVEDTPPDLA